MNIHQCCFFLLRIFNYNYVKINGKEGNWGNFSESGHLKFNIKMSGQSLKCQI